MSLYDKALQAITRAQASGDAKYGDTLEQSLENTYPDKEALAAQGHLIASMRGERYDTESGEPHAAHAAARCIRLVMLQIQAEEKDSRC